MLGGCCLWVGWLRKSVVSGSIFLLSMVGWKFSVVCSGLVGVRCWLLVAYCVLVGCWLINVKWSEFLGKFVRFGHWVVTNLKTFFDFNIPKFRMFQKFPPLDEIFASVAFGLSRGFHEVGISHVFSSLFYSTFFFSSPLFSVVFSCSSWEYLLSAGYFICYDLLTFTKTVITVCDWSCNVCWRLSIIV